MTPTVHAIVCACAAEWGTTPDLIYGPRRKRELVLPRQAAMYLASDLRPDLSLATIGRQMNRDTKTVMHGVRRVAERMQADEGYARRVGRARLALGPLVQMRSAA